MELSTTLIELHKEALKIENDKILLKNKAKKVKEIYEIFFKHKLYEKCKILLNELFTKDIELIEYYVTNLLPGMMIDDSELPLIMPDSGIKYKHIKWFKFNTMRGFINFFNK